MDEIPLLLQALHFAADKHRDHRRKDVHASPYINHTIQVAEVLATTGNVKDPEVLAAALLHDTVEDTETTLAELEQAFGARVARIVGEVTDNKELPKQERKRLQIEHARHLSREATLVKLGDKIANVRDLTTNPPPSWSHQRKKEYLDWAEEVIRNCPRVNPRLESEFRQVLSRGRQVLGA
jgi:(p)ppGpp synthase/HD superfamily hydrolase